MRNREKILDHLLLWAQLFRVHDHEFALMGLTKMDEQLVPEPSQPILMGEDHPLNLPVQNGVHQGEELFPLEISPTADFHDPFVHLDTALSAKTSQNGLLGD